ncbi:MAG TPA: phosphatidylserine decarboxylase [Campylobacterales bacterium]|nr:phosphatidylserine decarboxylase [Campylobacterales bacterium]HHS92415.1 phosphatidylserine decarboxylase [Campylobacterales bacterium]
MKKHYSSIISNLFGKFASRPFSKPIQKIINKSYVRLMGLDMSEFQTPESYPTLNALFTRSLVNPRPIPKDEKTLISPADSLITDFGTITQGKAYQIKGMEYQIEELFGSYHQEAAKAVEGGVFMNFYLSPKDYHRYHTPDKITIDAITHIPGKLYPVNFPLLRNKKNLFIENERVIVDARDENGKRIVLVLVGALNVGKMIVTFEENIHTNGDIREIQHYRYEELTLEKGELFGWFEMGSTILIFTQEGYFTPNVEVNQKIKFTESIGVKA